MTNDEFGFWLLLALTVEGGFLFLELISIDSHYALAATRVHFFPQVAAFPESKMHKKMTNPLCQFNLAWIPMLGIMSLLSNLIYKA